MTGGETEKYSPLYEALKNISLEELYEKKIKMDEIIAKYSNKENPN